MQWRLKRKKCFEAIERTVHQLHFLFQIFNFVRIASDTTDCVKFASVEMVYSGNSGRIQNESENSVLLITMNEKISIELIEKNIVDKKTRYIQVSPKTLGKITI